MADNLSFNQEMLSMNMYKKAKQIYAGESKNLVVDRLLHSTISGILHPNQLASKYWN
jgi:hypothetical protein